MCSRKSITLQFGGYDMQKKFAVESSNTNEALGRALEFIHDSIAALRLNTKDSNRAELMCEESLVNLMKHSDFSVIGYFRVNVRKVFGDVIIDFVVPGSEFEFSGPAEILPLKDNDALQESYESIQRLVLHSFMQYIRYKHSGKFNTVRIKAVRSNYSGVCKTLAALFLAVISGLLLRAFAPEAVYMSLNDNILVPIRSVFLNGLNMCVIPIVFCSIVSCISDIGGLSGLKQAGGKLIKYFVMANILGLAVGLCLMYIFRPGAGANMSVTSPETVQTQSLSLVGNLVNVIAGNIVRPFLDGDMLQIMVLAFFVGLATSLTGAKMIRTFSSEVNMVFMKITELFLYLTYIVVFCSVASMIITTGTETLVSAAGVIFTLIGGYVIIFAILCIAVKIFARLNPFTMIRKSVPLLATSFSTCSSIASIPDALKCSDDMGIPSSLYSFSVPLGLSLGKVTTPLYYSVLVLSAANMYGVDISPSLIVSLSVTIILLSNTTPALPGSGVIYLSVLLTQAGCPLEFLGLAVSIEMLTDFTATMAISFGNLVHTLLTAADDNILDREKFNRP